MQEQKKGMGGVDVVDECKGIQECIDENVGP